MATLATWEVNFPEQQHRGQKKNVSVQVLLPFQANEGGARAGIVCVCVCVSVWKTKPSIKSANADASLSHKLRSVFVCVGE